MAQHRDGGKFRGDHGSFLDLSAVAADILVTYPEVTGVSSGFVKNGAGSTGGSRRIKIADMLGGILLTVRQSRSVQEVRVFTKNVQVTKLALARALRDRDIPIAFK